MNNSQIVVVVRKSPRFQLVKDAIDSLSPTGVYHLIADADGEHPIEYKATRKELESVFSAAMKTPSYRERGRYHRQHWSIADQFKI